MNKTLSITGIIMLLACTPASADYFSAQADNGSRAFSDRPMANASHTTRVAGKTVSVPDRSDLAGTWTAEGENGRYIHFSIEENGKFVFDERNRDTPARLYMCGRIDTGQESLELTIRARKEMQSTGVTTESRDVAPMALEVISAQSNRLVLDVDGTQLVFFRS